MYSLTIPCDVAFAESTLLSAGELNCLYESGNLVQIRFRDQELIRKIYGAVRLHNWDTLPVQVQELDIQSESASFKISFIAVYGKSKPLFRAKYIITGSENNLIRMSMEGEVLEEFSRNRLGLCVLHPVEPSQGADVMVTRADGSEYQGSFPEDVSPHQPFFDITAMRWKDNSGNDLSLLFQGDIFEMEDQRNWSDHSFKTYSTPQSLPRPVTLAKGEKIFQSVELSGIASGISVPERKAPAEKFDLPKIGYVLPVDHQIDQDLLEHFANIPVDHLRVSVDPSIDSWNSTLQGAIDLAEKLSVKLEVLLFLNSADLMQEFVESFAPSGSLFYSILSIVSHDKFLQVYDRLKLAFPNTLIGYGADDSFANLNRNRPSGLTFDFLSFSITPQGHASDNRTIVENLFSHAGMLATARSFSDGKPIHISPITLIDRGLAEREDPRQYSEFLAAWALHIFQTMAGVGLITFFDLVGENGIIKKQSDKIIFSAFFKVLKALKEFGAVSIMSSHNKADADIIFGNSTGEQLTIRTDILSRIAIQPA